MADREKVFDALRNCVTEPKCRDCPWEECERFDCKKVSVPANLLLDALKLLKEQEIGHWVVLENCSNAGVYCSECHRKIFDHYPMRKQLSYFCPHCGTRMEGQEVK